MFIRSEILHNIKLMCWQVCSPRAIAFYCSFVLYLRFKVISKFFHCLMYIFWLPIWWYIIYLGLHQQIYILSPMLLLNLVIVSTKACSFALYSCLQNLRANPTRHPNWRGDSDFESSLRILWNDIWDTHILYSLTGIFFLHFPIYSFHSQHKNLLICCRRMQSFRYMRTRRIGYGCDWWWICG